MCSSTDKESPHIGRGLPPPKTPLAAPSPASTDQGAAARVRRSSGERPRTIDGRAAIASSCAPDRGGAPLCSLSTASFAGGTSRLAGRAGLLARRLRPRGCARRARCLAGDGLSSTAAIDAAAFHDCLRAVESRPSFGRVKGLFQRVFGERNAKIGLFLYHGSVLVRSEGFAFMVCEERVGLLNFECMLH